jgi:hypothetical protein
MTLQEALQAAEAKEGETGNPAYILYNRISGEYQISDRMPFFGIWYTSDGIRHG